MKRPNARFASSILCLAAMAFPSLSTADDNSPPPVSSDWHQWRGPIGNGVAPGGNPPLKFGANENLLWKVEIPGHGSSSPIVWGDHVFVLSAEKSAEGKAEAPKPDDAPADSADGDRRRRRGGRDRSAPKDTYRFLVHCLDRATGKTVWQKTAIEAVPHEGHHAHHGYASPSPVTDGKRLIASFGSRGIFAYDLEGKKLWERDLGDMTTRNSFGEGSSPALYNDLVFVQWDNERDSKFFALDAATGEIRWSADREEASCWATPIVVEHGGVAQVIANATKRVRSYDAKTGELLWSCPGQTVNVIPSPVVANGVVYCMSGFKGAALKAIKLDARGDLKLDDPAIVWSHSQGTPYVPSPLLYENNLHFFSGNKNVLSILDARDGKVLVERRRLEGLGDIYASPVGAAGRVYIVDRDGMVMVLENGPEAKQLALNDMEEPIDASPAISGGQMFLRGASHLFCVAEKAK